MFLDRGFTGFQKQYGEQLPHLSVNAYNYTTGTGQYNLSSGNSPSTCGHNLEYTAPNITVNTGADYTISPSLVSTTRFGYYFENYHDLGYPPGARWIVGSLMGFAGQRRAPVN